MAEQYGFWCKPYDFQKSWIFSSLSWTATLRHLEEAPTERKEVHLWVSERKSNHRNDSLWDSESLKAHLLQGWLVTGQDRDGGFINMAVNSQDSKGVPQGTVRLCGAWKTRGMGQTSGPSQRQLSWEAWHLFSCVGNRWLGLRSSWRARLTTNHRTGTCKVAVHVLNVGQRAYSQNSGHMTKWVLHGWILKQQQHHMNYHVHFSSLQVSASLGKNGGSKFPQVAL